MSRALLAKECFKRLQGNQRGFDGKNLVKNATNHTLRRNLVHLVLLALLTLCMYIVLISSEDIGIRTSTLGRVFRILLMTDGSVGPQCQQAS